MGTASSALALILAGTVLFAHPEGLHPSQDSARRCDDGTAQNVVHDMVTTKRLPIIILATQHQGFCRPSAARARSRRQPGRLFIGLGYSAWRGRSSRLRPKFAIQASSLHAESAGDPDRRPRVEEPLSAHDAGSDIGALSAANRLVDEVRSAAVQDVTSISSSAIRASVEITASARRRSASRRRRSSRRYERLRVAPSLDDLHAGQTRLGGDGAPAALPTGSLGDESVVRAREHRRAGAAERRRADHAECRRVEREPLRPAAVGDAVVQPAPRRRSRSGDGRGPAHVRPDPAGVDHHGVLRNSAGLPEYAGGHARAARDRDLRDLRGIGNQARASSTRSRFSQAFRSRRSGLC